MNDLKRVFVAVCILGLAGIPTCLSAGRTTDDNEPILQLLDASIRQADEFRKEKERTIASLMPASHPSRTVGSSTTCLRRVISAPWD